MKTRILHTLGFGNTIGMYVKMMFWIYVTANYIVPLPSVVFLINVQQVRGDDADDPTTYLVSFDEHEARYVVSTLSLCS